MPSIRSFTMSCEDVNEYGTFSEGDTVRGKITLVLVKETTVDSFFVKCKGDANVRWNTKSGDETHKHSAHRRYFKLKQSILDEGSPDKVIHQGTHVYDFCFTIPTRSLPSTCKENHGNIIYMVEAKLVRSWKMTRTLERELKFVSKANSDRLTLMTQQVASTDKEMGLFSRGRVHMVVTLDRHGYATGDTIAAVATIHNASSRDMVPKFCLTRDVQYHAKSQTKNETKVLCKQNGELVTPYSQKIVKCSIQIPHGLTPTINSCEILRLQYHLKVYLDISFAFDPEVLLPVIICHPEIISNVNSVEPGRPHPSTNLAPFLSGASGGSPLYNRGSPTVSRGSPTVSRGSPTVSRGSPPYRHFAAHNYPAPQYPPQPTYQRNQPGYGNPYIAPSSTFHPPPSASGYHPSPSAPEFPTLPPSAPSAPPYNFQPSAPQMGMDFLSQSDEPPPSYSLLFPDSVSERPNAN